MALVALIALTWHVSDGPDGPDDPDCTDMAPVIDVPPEWPCSCHPPSVNGQLLPFVFHCLSCFRAFKGMGGMTLVTGLAGTAASSTLVCGDAHKELGKKAQVACSAGRSRRNH
eukprot:1152902-Pelagomonas_calceolata.AAC.2